MEKYENIQEGISESADELGQTTQDRLASMRKKADLSDIILEKEHSSHDKKKKFLLGAASLVLIFLIVLVISKMINDSSSDSANNKLDTNNTLSSKIQKVAEESTPTLPALQTQNTTQKLETPKTSTQTTTSKKDEKLNDTDLKFEEMVRKLKEQDAKENGSELPSTNVVATKQAAPIKTVTKKLEIKDVTPKKEKNLKITSTPTKEVIKHSTKPKSIDIKIPSFKEFTVSKGSGYYIQVGATTRPQPNRTLINKIKSNGFSYTTHAIRVKGRDFNKILVGPYSSKATAQSKLGRVRATINPKAFLYHLR